MSKKFLAIIPARGGSKRLPNKNILDFNGKPLIAYSIEAGIESQYIDKVLVSSDSDRIIATSKEFAAETVKRPESLATDTATTFDVIEHAIQSLPDRYEYTILLQPTSPLRTTNHIDEAIKLLEKKKADAVISVCKMEHSPLWANRLDENLSMEKFFRDDLYKKRSQELDIYYRLNGAIYIARTDRLLEERCFFLKDNIFAYIMDKRSSIDIDEKIDFDIAAIFQRALNEKV